MNILHENSHGIQMIRVDMKKRSKVTIVGEYVAAEEYEVK